MTVGDNIKRIRIQRGLTQKKLGSLLEISASTIRSYELGRRVPKGTKLQDIADALNVNVEVLESSVLNKISAMYRLFQLFRQYGGYFDQSGNLRFREIDLSSWHDRWKVYMEEIRVAWQLPDPKAREAGQIDAINRFDYWMDNYGDERDA